MASVPSVTLRRFEPEDQDAVKELILQGLEEHWGWRDQSKNPDLDDISQSYADSLVIVATDGPSIVGTGALVPRGDGVGEVVRMSVAADRRRRGIGSAVLAELIAAARRLGYGRLILETTATWADVIAFYQRHGFRFTHEYDGDAYFDLEWPNR
jgi:putative acetyltransferase